MDEYQTSYKSSNVLNKSTKAITALDVVFLGHKSLLHKKTERIVAALFLVTDHLTDNHPIRRKVRVLGVDLMSFILLDPRTRSCLGITFVDTYASRLLEIVSLLEIAFLSGQLSEVNFKVLSSEIGRLVAFIGQIKRKIEFPAKNPEISAIFSGRGSGGSKGHITGNSLSGKLRKHVFDKGHSGHISRLASKKPPMSFRETKQELKATARISPTEKAKRREMILGLLAEGKSLAVKDFLLSFPDFSEKTVQRELVSLVRSGVLKKEGKLRWSKYSLAHGGAGGGGNIQQVSESRAV